MQCIFPRTSHLYVCVRVAACWDIITLPEVVSFLGFLLWICDSVQTYQLKTHCLVVDKFLVSSYVSHCLTPITLDIVM